MRERRKSRWAGDNRFHRRKRIRQILILPGFVAALVVMRPGPADGWGSTTNSPYGAYATHQFIEETAYAALTLDPAFYPGALPPLEKLNEWAGNTVSTNTGKVVISGPGPDADGNSLYSQHWYNPRNGEGLGPMAVGDNALGAVESTRSDAQKVDWGAHFLADMSTPVHVNGAMLNVVMEVYGKASNNAPIKLSADITGHVTEYPLLSINRWKERSSNWRPEIENFIASNRANPKVDFFDPWYWDSALVNTHAYWEIFTLVQPYHSSFDKHPKYSTDWRNGAPSFESYATNYSRQAYEFAIKAAKTVEAISTGAQIQAGAQPAEDAQAAMECAIENVYTFWRASFSALQPRILTASCPGSGGSNKLAVTGRVANRAKEAVTNVRCRLTVEDLQGKKQSLEEKTIARIPGLVDEAKVETEVGPWEVDLPAAGKDLVFRLEVIGAYSRTPDLQYAKCEATPAGRGYWKFKEVLRKKTLEGSTSNPHEKASASVEDGQITGAYSYAHEGGTGRCGLIFRWQFQERMDVLVPGQTVHINGTVEDTGRESRNPNSVEMEFTDWPVRNWWLESFYLKGDFYEKMPKPGYEVKSSGSTTEDFYNRIAIPGCIVKFSGTATVATRERVPKGMLALRIHAGTAGSPVSSGGEVIRLYEWVGPSPDAGGVGLGSGSGVLTDVKAPDATTKMGKAQTANAMAAPPTPTKPTTPPATAAVTLKAQAPKTLSATTAAQPPTAMPKEMTKPPASATPATTPPTTTPPTPQPSPPPATTPPATTPAAPPTVPVGEPVNLALHKPATQSSIYQQNSATYGPQTGVDGKTNETWITGFFHTDRENIPWWQVDLQKVHAIREIRLFNRTQQFPERARTIQVQLSTNGTDWETIYRHNGSVWTRLNVPVDGKSARFVRAQLNEANCLHLKEIEVYGVNGAAGSSSP